jgi:hypothetical protein
MNICILYGKVISDIEYKFIIHNKNKAIARFEMELLNKSIVKVKAYDDISDYIYRNLSKGAVICIYGYLDSNGKVILQELPEIKNTVKL